MKIFLFIVCLLCAGYVCRAESELLLKLQQIKEISDIQRTDVDGFEEYYTFRYEQPVDHENPAGVTFKQRVALGHRSDKAPIVVDLEGYTLKETFKGELVDLLKANQIRIEHRFFDQSVPESGIDWNYLTIRQAATDHHNIITSLKQKLYPSSKWISTGVSKGGQATIYHRYFYPEDVDVSVPYVAPLNLEQVDPRINKLLGKLGTNKVGLKDFIWGAGNNTEECFVRVRDFQKLCFENIGELVTRLESEAVKKEYAFLLAGGVKRAVELIILEYQFSYWQWGYDCMDIPIEFVDLDAIYRHLVMVSDPTFFEDKNIVKMYPFMYAAFTEIGIYTYNISPFKHYLKDKSDITFSFALPKNVELKPFNKEQMSKINIWLQTEAEQMLFIYGGLDPWSATAVELKNNYKCNKYVKSDKHHGCRIKDFEAITRQDILDTLKEWLK
ncbi:peptidase [Odoribacter sp. OttesenSCG-928-J03]|nr:peptidase [Odoribacter sp. OttesenSCG-928-J03]MDL2283390.1 peptidase [Odoribacter sp. OttesenSCG-928-G04]